MYTTENYIWGWIFYTTGVFCLLGVYWLLIRKIAIAWVKHILVLLALVLFFTPVSSYPDNPYLAPAFFVSLYEGLIARGDDLGFQRGLAPILAIALFTVVLYLIGRLLVRVLPFSERKHTPLSKPSKRP
jgi:hypothetical protein